MKTLVSVLLATAIAFASALPVRAAVERAHEPERIPFKTDPVVGAGDVWRIIGATFAAIVLAVGAVYAIKVYATGGFDKGAQQQRRIRLLETRRLTPKATLFLVEVDGKTLLLGQHGDRIARLDSRDGPEAGDQKGGD